MNVFAELKIDYSGGRYGKGETVSDFLEAFHKCRLSFQGVEFKDATLNRLPKMIVQVALFNVDNVDAPRHEGEAEELVQRELDKAGLSASVLIVHGTQYIDETLPRV